MATEFLGVIGRFTGLSSQAIRSIARNYFPAFYERNISANQALRILREAGLGYRRKEFLRDYRAGREIHARYTLVRYVGEERVPSERILYPEYHGVPDRYSFVFRIELRNTLTGEEKYEHFYYHRDTLRKRREMENEAREWFISHYEWVRDWIPGRVDIREGYINPIFAL